MNKVTLIGRIASEIKTSEYGENQVSKFAIAVSRKGKEKETDFFDVESWNNTSKFISKFAEKGILIAIDGEVRTSSYEKDGKNIKRVFIQANEIQLLEYKKKVETEEFKEVKEEGKQEKSWFNDFSKTRQTSLEDVGEDDLPF